MDPGQHQLKSSVCGTEVAAQGDTAEVDGALPSLSHRVPMVLHGRLHRLPPHTSHEGEHSQRYRAGHDIKGSSEDGLDKSKAMSIYDQIVSQAAGATHVQVRIGASSWLMRHRMTLNTHIYSIAGFH
jgi:hypothetical protein